MLYKKVMALPLPMIELLSLFKTEPVPLIDSLQVSCSSEAILVKGRYVKLARDVSQTPWNLITPNAIDADEDDGVGALIASGAHVNL